MSGRQGFITNGQTYVYQNSNSNASAAFGIDSADSDKWKLIAKTTDTALPSGTCQMTIDPSTNGNITFVPNGSGTVSIPSIQTTTYGGLVTMNTTGGLGSLVNSHTNGQVLIASSTGAIAWANITSTANTLAITNGTSTINIDTPASLQTFTGRYTWGGSGGYFDDTVLGSFTISRAGTGFIHGIPISWTAPQTVTGLTAGNTYFIYIDNTGTIGKTSTWSESLYLDNIILFECLRDSTSPTNLQITVKEDHPYDFQTHPSTFLHEAVGTIIQNTANGANITHNGTQGIQINGADTLLDHGLTTTISDSGGSAVTWNKYYTNGSGKWAEQNSTTTFTGYWNNAGTPTALTAGRFAVYTLYASKDNLTSSTPVYFAVLDTSQYTNQAAANTAIANGTTAKATNELMALELCQLGYIVYRQSTSAITVVTISKSTLKQTLSTGGTNTASLVVTDTTNFNGILSVADTNVQAALDTIDNWGAGTTNHCVVIGHGVGTALGVTAVGSTGQILTGVSSNDPTWTTATYPATVATGNILTATGTNVIGIIDAAAATTGYVLTAVNGAAPTFQAAGAGSAWLTKTNAIANGTAAVNTSYTINNSTPANLTTLTLPTTFAVADRVEVIGNTSGKWNLTAGAGTTIKVLGATTSSGGSLAATTQYDCVEVIGVVANTTWVAKPVGNLTIA